MSRMSEQHDDLSTIHAILLGQRQGAQRKVDSMSRQWGLAICGKSAMFSLFLERIQTIDDLLLEFEAAGVVWPDNVVELSVQESWDQGKPVFYHG